MKSNLSQHRIWHSRFLSVFSLATLTLSLLFTFQTAQAQQPAQLSLADILIGLRSKKVTIDERNKLLSDAVKVRGITFSPSPEIETELKNTGASSELIETIKQISSKASATVVSKSVAPVSSATPKAPDFAFYQKRGNESVVKGEYDSAISDFNEAIKLNPTDTAVYLSRGRAHSNKKNYDLAIGDYNKVIEINPNDATAYFNRGESYEKKGNAAQAIGDYQKVIELDKNNESAKIILKRLQDEQAKIEQAKAEQLKAEQSKIEEAKKQEAAKLQAQKTPVIPKSVEVGALNSLATKLAQPVYPMTAQTLNLQGKVTVQVELDEEGKVISAKAVNGHQFLRSAAEEAVRRSKFKPSMVSGQAVKTTGVIIYNFIGK